jgi:predicted Zn-dependent protease
MIGEDRSVNLLKRIIQQSTADQTEALLFTEDSSLTRFANSSIHQHMSERNHTLILRVVIDKKIAILTTNIIDRLSVKDLLNKALSIARAQKPNEEFISLPRPEPIPKISTYSDNIQRLNPNRKISMINNLFKIVSEKGLRASGSFSNGVIEVSIVNSLGIESYQKYSDIFFHLILENDYLSGYSSFVSRDPDLLNIESIANEAMKKVWNKEAIEIEPGEFEVVLEPYAVSELISFLGYLGFHALAVQEGRSFFCNNFGNKMVNDRVTIYDDGLDPEGLQVPFDFEGVPKKRVSFFEKGIAKEVTYDSFTAGREGKSSTGHALIPPNTTGPIPINLFMEGGDSSLEEMITSVRRGIYVTRFHYTNVVEPMKAVITGMTRDGTFLIEKGEIQRPLKNLRFTESILRALNRVTLISKDRRICSEGTVYTRRFITGTVVPAIKVDGFNFSGVSKL